MKPIAIFRHSAGEGPGYLADFLDRHAIPWQLMRIDAGDAVPADAVAFSGLAFMGGPMSVNDPLPWVARELALIRDAHARDIPLLGHCLGGQLIARALGGRVSGNPVKELGWGKVSVAANETARQWFGDIEQFEAFHWHGESFSLPPGAVLLMSSPHCVNQAFAIGKHLGMQCHVEMTEAMIRDWCAIGADEIAAAMGSPAVQSAELMQAQMHDKLPRMRQVAERLYGLWLRGLECEQAGTI